MDDQQVKKNIIKPSLTNQDFFSCQEEYGGLDISSNGFS